MQIGMELLVIDWAQEEPKMAQIIRHIYLCLLLIIQFLNPLCNIFFSQINSAEGVLPNDVFWKNIHFTVFKISVKMQF